MLIVVIIFIIILSVLIFVHEFGHFLLARRNGVKAEEFGFGYPPRIIGVYKDKERKKWRWVAGNKNIESDDTIYSLNWIPFGGFVKIKGENGYGEKDSDSLLVKSAWVKIKIMGAGIAMNFLFAWIVLSIVLMIGAPQAVEQEGGTLKNAKIQVSEVIPDSSAEKMGIKVGDELVGCVSDDALCKSKFSGISQIQEFIGKNKGKEVVLKVQRGKNILKVKGVPRIDYPENQGSLGISMVQTAIVSYPWYRAIWEGLTATFNLIVLIVMAFLGIIRDLVTGEKVAVEVTGPVGIAYLTKQVADLGLVYVLQFMALLSVNLGIINGLPFPALDGGRILFILIEKIKGSPISQKIENAVHTIGFAFLIVLMVVVTFHDLIKFEIFNKIKGIF